METQVLARKPFKIVLSMKEVTGGPAPFLALGVKTVGTTGPARPSQRATLSSDSC